MPDLREVSFMLSITINPIMLGVVMLSIVLLSVVMPSVIMLRVIMPGVVMMNVVAPYPKEKVFKTFMTTQGQML
jgi:hypothetical protein